MTATKEIKAEEAMTDTMPKPEKMTVEQLVDKLESIEEPSAIELLIGEGRNLNRTMGYAMLVYGGTREEHQELFYLIGYRDYIRSLRNGKCEQYLDKVKHSSDKTTDTKLALALLKRQARALRR